VKILVVDGGPEYTERPNKPLNTLTGRGQAFIAGNFDLE